MKKIVSHWQLGLETWLLAISMLSRLPVATTFSARFTGQHYRLAPYFYAPVGLIFGLCLWLLSSILAENLDNLLTASIIVTVWLCLSGGLHLVSLANSVDAFFASHGNPAKAQLVFKDPVSGPMAVIAVVMCLLIKVSVLAHLSNQWFVPVLMSLVWARLLASCYLSTTVYCPEPTDTGDLPVLNHPTLPKALLIQLVVFFVGSLFLTDRWVALGVFVVAITIILVWRRLMLTLIGGFNGDTVGASIELIEVSVLLLLGLTL